MSEQLVIDRASLRNLLNFLNEGNAEQAALEAAYLAESNPTSILLFELQQYIQDAQIMFKSDDCEAQELGAMYLEFACHQCKKIRKSVKTYI